MYVQELHNSMVGPPESGEIKEIRDVDNIIIISDSTLGSIMPPQRKKMSEQYKVMCGCQFWISTKTIQ